MSDSHETTPVFILYKINIYFSFVRCSVSATAQAHRHNREIHFTIDWTRSHVRFSIHDRTNSMRSECVCVCVLWQWTVFHQHAMTMMMWERLNAITLAGLQRVEPTVLYYSHSALRFNSFGWNALCVRLYSIIYKATNGYNVSISLIQFSVCFFSSYIQCKIFTQGKAAFPRCAALNYIFI